MKGWREVEAEMMEVVKIIKYESIERWNLKERCGGDEG